MAEVLRGCLAKIGFLTVLVLAVGAGWLFRDRLSDWWRRLEVARVGAPSEELAAAAERKLRRLGEASPPVEASLTEAELQSLVLYRLAPGLPPGVESPAIEVRDSTLVVTALLRLDRLTGVRAADMLRAMLSDSASLTAELAPRLVRRGEARVDVLVLQAGSVVVPPVMVGPLLARMEIPGTRTVGRGVVFPVPEDLAEIRVTPDALELATRPPTRGQDGAAR